MIAEKWKCLVEDVCEDRGVLVLCLCLVAEEIVRLEEDDLRALRAERVLEHFLRLADFCARFSDIETRDAVLLPEGHRRHAGVAL